MYLPTDDDTNRERKEVETLLLEETQKATVPVIVETNNKQNRHTGH